MVEKDELGDASLETNLERLLADPKDGEAYFALFELIRRLRLQGEPNPLITSSSLKVAVVTASDSKFMPITNVMLNSIPPALCDGALDRCILDVGLTDEDRRDLEARSCSVVEPGWDIPFPGIDRAKPHFRALVSRPFLAHHFPGRHVYLAIDADAWIQVGECLDDLVLGALRASVAVVPEVSPVYATHFRLSLAPDQDFSVVEWNRRVYRKYFGEAEARAHGDRPLINSGVVASRADSPHWSAYAEAMARGLRTAPDTELHNSFVEQTALNYAIYQNDLPHLFLPAIYNWISHRANPVVNPVTELMCEPSLPHRPIQILHLTGPKKVDSVKLRLIGGGPVRRSVESFVAKRGLRASD